MPQDEQFSTVTLTSYKAFENYTLHLRHTNILCGPNNCGKSTLIGAFRILAEAIRKARSRSPQLIDAPDGPAFGYYLDRDTLPVSTENVHTNYKEVDTVVSFTLSSRSKLDLLFSATGAFCLIPRPSTGRVRTPSDFRKLFPATIAVIPVLGPMEHEEPIVLDKTVKESLHTHRASRHFRNYWHYFPADFPRFADLITKTWPGMVIRPPEMPDLFAKHLVMFAEEHRIPRELYWSGFGFQIWCQLLTHIVRASNSTLIVVDEPEIYLHPDLQRQLLGILRDVPSGLVMATHSSEILADADPSDIVLIDKNQQRASRLTDIDAVQRALDIIGSVQNITLTQLARSRRVLFVEGLEDFQTLRKFAKVLGFPELGSGQGITPFEAEGRGSLEKVLGTGWGVQKTLGGELTIAAIFDRDYSCDEEVDDLEGKLNSQLHFGYVLSRKEMENFLLNIPVLQRLVERAAAKKGMACPKDWVYESLQAITEELRDEIQTQYLGHRQKYLHRTGLKGKQDPASMHLTTVKWFSERWADMNRRLEIIPGKEILKRLRGKTQASWGIGLTASSIISEHKREEVPAFIRSVITKLETFRTE